MISFGHAINRALRDALEQDSTVILLGEDIGKAGGPFGVTRKLQSDFGDRVRDTPISEATITGAALGAALTGLKPVVEIMFMDFVTLALDQLVNQAAKAHFMFGGQRSAPMVLRTPHGGGQNAGPQHSQCLEAWLAHVPGLIVVCPSNPADAYGLLRSAIDNPNPVVFVENKSLYSMKGELPDSPPHIPLGAARVARPGRDVTLVTYGAMVGRALDAAGQMETRGCDVEVIDLRSLQPWDTQTVIESVAKTHRLVVAHEAVASYGPGAEIAAYVGQHAFDELDAPIVRVGARFAPIPFAPALESRVLPNAHDLVTAVEEVLR
jgi:pyruvate dehydrogenase E1 component beta subunit